MRIFSAVKHANDPKEFYGSLWSSNFYPALRELGYEVIESQVDLFATSHFMGVADGFTRQEIELRAQTTEQILSEVRSAHRIARIDLFLSYFYNSHFDPLGFDELRRLQIPTVNFYCNSIYQFDQVAGIAAKVDFSWHPEREARAAYLKAGARPVWVQMGADANLYRPVSGVSRQKKACFVGQRYADRDRWMAALIQGGVPMDIYGPGWGLEGVNGKGQSAPSGFHHLGRSYPVAGSRASYIISMQQAIRRHGWIRGTGRLARQWQQRRESRKLARLFPPSALGPLPFSQIAAVFSNYELIVNFSNVWSDGRPGSPLIPHVRLRDFEAPMCRSCYLTGHTNEITEFYEIGKEIDTYRTQEELVEKARFYLSHPEAAAKLREAGFRRAVLDHTWKRRFEQLFEKLNLR